MRAPEMSPTPATAPRRAVRKACQACRMRKAKCNGKRPQCGFCAQYNQPCHYLEDRRQFSRPTKAEIKGKDEEINSLRLLVKRLKETESLEEVRSLLGHHQRVLQSDRRSDVSIINTNGTGEGLGGESISSNECRATMGNHHAENARTMTESEPSPLRSAERAMSFPLQPTLSQSDRVITALSATNAPLPSPRPQDDGHPSTLRYRSVEVEWNHHTTPTILEAQDQDHQQEEDQEGEDSPIFHGPSSAMHELSNRGDGTLPEHSNFIGFGPYHRHSVSSQNGVSGSHLANATNDTGLPFRDFDDDALAPELQSVVSQLVAHAALQRHREVAHLYERRFDFDGLDPEMAMHFFDLHWNRPHLSYLITYRPAVMDSLANNGPYINKLLLNAIYFASATYSERSVALRRDKDDPQTVAAQFLDRFRECLQEEGIETPSVPSICGLILMGTALVSIGKTSPGWVYCGIAYRMVIDLGCHLEKSSRSSNSANGQLTALDIEIRKRVFWTAYVNDKVQSLYLGRPCCLQVSESEVSKRLLDTYEETEPWKPYIDPLYPSSATSKLLAEYVPRPTFAVSTFRALIDLAEIAEMLISSIYAVSSLKMSEGDRVRAFKHIGEALERWERKLPAHLKVEDDHPAPPHLLTLHTTYFALRILLLRPFFPGGHLYPTTITTVPSSDGTSIFFRHNSTRTSHQPLQSSSDFLTAARLDCYSAALSIRALVTSYRRSFTLGRAPIRLSYCILNAVMVFMQDARRSKDPSRNMEEIRDCYEALKETTPANLGLRKPLRIMKGLVQYLGLEQDTARDQVRESRGGLQHRRSGRDTGNRQSSTSGNINPCMTGMLSASPLAHGNNPSCHHSVPLNAHPLVSPSLNGTDGANRHPLSNSLPVPPSIDFLKGVHGNDGVGVHGLEDNNDWNMDWSWNTGVDGFGLYDDDDLFGIFQPGASQGTDGAVGWGSSGTRA
ncbi:Fungal Zn2-Cys6 binuclear cluster domain-containing protein [Cladophialophora immunda]|nr:Fungal Zn2-Cys6 binuclear cluster domain-containing protein [Cladophialophora immunda]